MSPSRTPTPTSFGTVTVHAVELRKVGLVVAGLVDHPAAVEVKDVVFRATDAPPHPTLARAQDES
jgi:hypothetical protein